MAQSAYNIPVSLVYAANVTDSSTDARGIIDISDATAIAGYVTGATAPGFIIQVSYTTEVGAVFFGLPYPSSTPFVQNWTSSAPLSAYLLGGRQLVLASTSATHTAGTFVGTKQVYL